MRRSEPQRELYEDRHQAPLAWSAIYVHTARFQFGANVVIQVLFYSLSFIIRQIIRKECN